MIRHGFVGYGKAVLREAPERAFVAKEVGLGDARAREGATSGRTWITLTGRSSDSLELRFAVDPTPAGWARSYLVSTTGWYRVHTLESADPDWALADRLVQEPGAMSRYSVSRINVALQAMAAASH